MEIVAALAGLFILVIVIGVPYLLISHGHLKAKVKELDDTQRALLARVAALGAGQPDPGTGAAAEVIPPAPAGDLTEMPSEPTAPVPAVPQPAAPDPRLTAPPEPAAAQDPATASPPRAYVFRADRAQALLAWLRDNWVLAVAGLSMALAGVFMVQYGVEKGLLTPFWRVIGALGLGGALIATGEAIRRRHGDEGGGATQSLPSTLSAAGLISLFAGVLAARGLYDLIGPGPALLALVAVSGLAVVLGWLYGPLLAAGGIIGATAAPFLVGGDSDAPWLFYYYFALIACAGLAVDTFKRWAWVSALVLLATVSASALIYLGGAGAEHFLVFMALVSVLALIIPDRRLQPRHQGTSFLGMVAGQRPLPEFPTRLAIAMVAAASGAAVVVGADASQPLIVWLAFGMLAVMLAAALWWLRHAPALQDLALAPAAGFIALIVQQAPYPGGPLYAAFTTAPLPEAAPPLTVTLLLALAAAATLPAFWRMTAAARAGASGPAILWAIGTATFAPGVALVFEFLWGPAGVLGAYGWALHVIALAALMTLLAERTRHGVPAAEPRLRTALFAVAALTLIALALFLLLTKAALTLALAVMVLATVLIDRRYDLPLLGWFVQLGVAVIGYRLVIDPGFYWAIDDAPMLHVTAAYGGPLVLLAAAWKMLDHRPQSAPRIVVESGVWTIAAVFACVLLFRSVGEDDVGTHWGMGLLATIWFVTMACQIYRLRAGGRLMRIFRIVLAVIFGLIGLLFAALQMVIFNPLSGVLSNEILRGPMPLDTLALAYLPLATVFAVTAWKLEVLPRWMRRGCVIIAAGYGVFYLALEIRRFWRGPDLSVPGVTQPELYTYTVALLLASVGLLVAAFARRSVLLRKIAMLGVALTIAKVFLIDMSGLTGLIRVASFMGLGLALAGLAWFNRQMSLQWENRKPSSSDDR